MRAEITAATKAAMKAGLNARVRTLRLIGAAIKDRDIAARVDDKGRPTGRDAITDEEVLQLLQKLVKQRREAADTYREAGRMELAEQEEAEIDVIEEFLPKQMSDDEIRAAVAAVIDETGASGLKDMGKVMAALKERHAGRLDFSKASGFAKAMLQSD